MNQYEIKPSSRFKKDLKRLKKRGYDLSLLTFPIDTLASGQPLPPAYLDHPLKGNLKKYRECHITPDWVLIYEIWEDQLILYLMTTGTHDETMGV